MMRRFLLLCGGGKIHFERRQMRGLGGIKLRLAVLSLSPYIAD